MAEESQVQEQVEEQTEAPKKRRTPRPDLFTVKNVVRRVQTRIRRAAAPGRRRFKQWVAGRRLLRNQSITLTPAEMDVYGKKIMDGVIEGALEVTDPDGWRYYADAQGQLVKTDGQQHIVLTERQPSQPPPPSPTGDESTDDPPSDTEEGGESEEGEEPEDEGSEEPDNAPTAPAPPDDLTKLPGIGGGRAKKFEAAGITYFVQIADMSAAALAEMMGGNVTEEAAQGVIDAASELANAEE